jgi:hypothetical protein
LAFAADGVKGHEKEGFEKPFGRHAGAAGRAVGGFEPRVERVENAVGALFEIAKRMVGTDAVFDFKGMEEGKVANRHVRACVVSALGVKEFSAIKLPCNGSFSAPC